MRLPRRIAVSPSLLIAAAVIGLGSGCTAVPPPARVQFPASPPRTILEQQLDSIFSPNRTDQAALSPDGRRIAFGVYERGQLRLNIIDIDQPGPKVDLLLGRDLVFGGDAPMTVMRPAINFLRWANADLLVYAFSDAGLQNSSAPRTEVHVVQADGTHDRKLTDRTSFARPSPGGVSGFAPGGLHVLGLAPTGSPAVLVEGPNPAAGWTTYRIDLGTGSRTALGTGIGFASHVILDAESRPRIAKITEQAALTMNAGRLPTYWYTEYPPPSGKARQDPIRAEFKFDDTNAFEPHAIPLGFGKDPDLLYFASNVGRDTYGIYAMTLKASQRTTFSIEDPAFDQADPRYQGTMRDDTLAEEILVYDRHHEVVGVRTRGLRPGTRWLSNSLAQWQERLDAAIPDRNVQILEWDDAQERVLVRVFSPSDRGTFAVYEDGSPLRNLGIIARAEEPDRALSPSETSNLVTEHGTHLTVSLVRPAGSSVAGLVLVCPDFPEGSPDRDRDAPNAALHAFAAMGYAAAELNYRGTFGFGSAHLGAGRLEADRLAAEDVHDAAVQLAARLGIDTTKVALVGTGFGGYVALRAAELYPRAFQAIATINAPSEPGKWLKGETFPFLFARKAAFLAASRTTYPDMSTRAGSILAPVMIINETASGGSVADVAESQATRLAGALRQAGRTVEFVRLGHEISRGLPTEKTNAYLRIGRFLDLQFQATKAGQGG